MVTVSAPPFVYDNRYDDLQVGAGWQPHDPWDQHYPSAGFEDRDKQLEAYLNDVVGTALTRYGAVLGRRNLASAGQIGVVSQRGTGPVDPATVFFLADRWTIQNVGVGVLATAIVATGTLGTVSPGRPQPAVIQRTIVTTAEAAGALAAGDIYYNAFRCEGQDLQHLNWGTASASSLTVSFDIFSTVASTYVAELTNTGAATRSISRAFNVVAGFQTITLTFPGDTGQAITNDNAARLQVLLFFTAGSTYTSGTLATTWGAQVNANRAPGVSNTFQATLNNVVAVTNFQMEIGTTATPYEVRPYAVELQEAMRYFERLHSLDNATAVFGQGIGLTGTTALFLIAFKVTKRATPTFAASAAATFQTFDGTGGGVFIALTAGPTLGQASRFGTTIGVTVAAGLGGDRNLALFANTSTAAFLDFSADI